MGATETSKKSEVEMGSNLADENREKDEILPYEEMDFNEKGFMVITTTPQGGGECYTTAYQRELLKTPCYGCGSEDHGFLTIYNEGGELYDRIGCVLSPHATSMRTAALGEEDYSNIYGMSPWKFIQHVGTENVEIAKTWDQYIAKGFGQYQERPERNKYWRAIKFFLKKRREYGSIEATYEKSEHNENKTLLDWETQYSEFAGPVEDTHQHPHQRVPCRWCGASDHAVSSKRKISGVEEEWTCPLRRMFRSDNIIRVNIKPWIQHHQHSLEKLEIALDEFEFQGLGWTLPSKAMLDLRALVTERCQEPLTQDSAIDQELSIR